jgi:phosphate starvation-inducible PhoH-like protein
MLESLKSARYEFNNTALFRHVCGIADQGIKPLSSLLGVTLIPRGNSLLIHSQSDELGRKAQDFFEKLEKHYKNRELPEALDLHEFYSLTSQGLEMPGEMQDRYFKCNNGRSIAARTRGQARLLRALNNFEVTVCEGPAGTGKTFLSVVAACKQLLKGQIERIVLCRPAVEAGESLGFLPGDLIQKVDPYLRPLYDALYECLGFEKVHELIARQQIEIVPLAFMRGRTLNRAMIILDEAQNCTLPQLKMFLTRPGDGSRICINGDNSQIDIAPHSSGLGKLMRILEGVAEVQVLSLGTEDIVRNPLVEKIIRAFEKLE